MGQLFRCGRVKNVEIGVSRKISKKIQKQPENPENSAQRSHVEHYESPGIAK
jgi:hypothetical protein